MSGHRKRHSEILARYANVYLRDKGKGNLQHLKTILIPKNLVFAMIDDNYPEFFAVAIFRMLIGKKTIGLFFRPATCFKIDIKSIMKFLVFFIFKFFPSIDIYLYLPIKCDLRFKRVSSGFVMDHEMWHQIEHLEAHSNSTTMAVKSETDKLRLLVIGNIAIHKGLKQLLTLLEANNSFKQVFEITLVGRTAPDAESINLRKKIAYYAYKNLDRYFSDHELDEFYKSTDFVWCFYDQNYDQSSGVFGTAIQYQRIPIVRAESLLSCLAEEFDFKTVELQMDKLATYDFHTFRHIRNDFQYYRSLAKTWKADYFRKLGIYVSGS
jgi:hypothetical protein